VSLSCKSAASKKLQSASLEDAAVGAGVVGADVVVEMNADAGRQVAAGTVGRAAPKLVERVRDIETTTATVEGEESIKPATNTRAQ